MENLRQKLIRRSYGLALNTIKFIDLLNKNDFSISIIAKQLLRSITSIDANIIEAQAGRSKKDFMNFLYHALKSANESKFWLGLLKDTGKTQSNECDKLLNETNEIANILGASILTLKGKRNL